MASSITNQADLLTHTNITDNELSRLVTERMDSTHWERLHVIAWTEVKELLLDRKPSIEEDDLDDSTELVKCTCLMVLYVAYDSAELDAEGSAKRKSYWYRKMRKELGRVPLTVNGSVLGTEAFGSRRSYRGS